MDYHYALVFVRLIVVLLGSVLVYLSLKAQHRNGSNGWFFLSIGFALITIGAVAAGVLFEFFTFDIFGALTIESILTTLGLISIIASIYTIKT
jgi:hypothetical protein